MQITLKKREALRPLTYKRLEAVSEVLAGTSVGCPVWRSTT